MSQLTLKGKVTLVKDIQNISDKFQKREFVIETEDQYPQLVQFELTQDKCSLLDSSYEGKSIEVFFNIRGREWNDKYFVNLQAWRVVVDGPSTSTATATVTSQEVEAAESSADDLPF